MGTADKDYFLDDNGEVTTDTEKAAVLLIRSGQDIPKEMADQYGIGEKKSKRAQPASTEEGEKASSPKSNKAEQPKNNKGAK